MIRAKNRIGPHNIDIISILIGSLLGDCYGEKRYGENIRFKFKQNIKNKDYLFMLHEIFYKKGYCSKNLPILYE